MSNDPLRLAEEHFARGNAFDEKGERNRALDEWEQAIALDPDHAAAHYNLGIAYADEDDNESAIEEFLQAVRLEPSDMDARLELAETLLDEDRTFEAIEQLHQVLAAKPQDSAASHLLAEACLYQGKPDEAAKLLETVSPSEGDADMWIEIGLAYERNQAREAAILAYQRALVAQPHHPGASAALEHATRPETIMQDEIAQSANEHFQRGNAFDEQGERDSAIQEWQAATEINPEHAGAHYNLGVAFADEGNAALAIVELRTAIKLAPFDTDSRRELAEIFLDENNPSAAIDQLRQLLNISPNDGDAAHRLAEILLSEEKWDEAAGALEAGGLLERDADLWFDVGQAYERESRCDDAILAYRRALAAKPDHSNSIDSLARLHVPIEEPADPDEIEGEASQ